MRTNNILILAGLGIAGYYLMRKAPKQVISTTQKTISDIISLPITIPTKMVSSIATPILSKVPSFVSSISKSLSVLPVMAQIGKMISEKNIYIPKKVSGIPLGINLDWKAQLGKYYG